ncbi:mechanosensitive ion channel protein MscS [Nitrospira sp.]|nr:mechanosensitive ion channel protein MscS [Nitrospira sp.]
MTESLTAIDESWLIDGLKTLALILTVLALRTLFVRWAASQKGLTVEDRRRWVVYIRNGMLLLFAVGMVAIWANELQAFAVSLVAIAAALVLATKELILCVSGAALRAGSKFYSIGDRIQVGTQRGIVLDHDLFATTLLEIGPGQASHLTTGRVVIFPNSLLFSAPIVNETFSKDYVFHVTIVPMRNEDDWQRGERVLTEAARAECAEYIQNAAAYLHDLEERNLMEAPNPEPKVTLQIDQPGRINLVLRFPVPVRGRARTEQAILRRFLTGMKAESAAAEGLA